MFTILKEQSGNSLHKLSPTWHIRSNQAKQQLNSLCLLRTQRRFGEEHLDYVHTEREKAELVLIMWREQSQ